MVECNVYELSKFYGAYKVFENISFEIKTGERIGLVGQNGCGKTTLMKIMMGLEEYEKGAIHLRKGAHLGYLEQIHHVGDCADVEEVLWYAFEKVTLLKRKMQSLEKDFVYLTGKSLEQAMTKYSSYMEEYERLDGYSLETKVNYVCEGLGISKQLRKMLFKDLSGGEKTRVILGRLLLESPDILLLDEPSNHLDISSIEWLENFLKEYKGAVMVISHDRYFLDQAVTKIYELTPDSMEVYYGNYSAYVVEKERRFLEDFRRYQNQQNQINLMKDQIHRYRVWGVARDSEVMYKRAKELEKRLEKIDVLDKPILENKRMRIDASIERRSGKRVITVNGIQKSFEEKQLIKNVDFTVFYGDSICLMGANGSGKTTLLKIILGEINPDAGTITIGEGVKIGYLPQHVVFEDEEKTLAQYFAYEHNISLGAARGALAKMLFTGEDVNKKIKSLSGGEKSRLRLCSLTYEKVNLLILDEPTNHLDIASREELEKALMDFEGTLFFVSHDRYFIEKTADQILFIDEGVIQSYPFGYKDFVEKRLACQKENEKDLSKAEKEKAKTIESKTMQDKTQKAKNTEENNKRTNNKGRKNKETNYNHLNRLAKVEEEIEILEEKQKSVLEAIEKDQFNYDALNELFKEQQEIEKQLEELYLKWEEMSS